MSRAGSSKHATELHTNQSKKNVQGHTWNNGSVPNSKFIAVPAVSPWGNLAWIVFPVNPPPVTEENTSKVLDGGAALEEMDNAPAFITMLSMKLAPPPSTNTPEAILAPRASTCTPF